MADLGLPNEVQNSKRHVFALVVMMSPCSASHLDEYFVTSQEIKEYLQDLKQTFCSVFRENSLFLRARFFSDPLIQHLWSHFLKLQTQVLTNYFEELRNTDDGVTLEVLVTDILNLSKQINYEILPDSLLQ